MTKRATPSIEAGRQQLRAILTRREFMTAASVGALSLAGCGSSPTGITPPPPPPGGGGIPTGFQSITGTVSLPSGSTLKTTDLTVDILAQTVPLSASGGFTIGISPSGPSLGVLLDKDGNGVMMGMFDPAAASREISPHSTAVSLLFYGVSGYLFPPAAQAQILTLLNADPAVTTLETALAGAIATDSHALANNASTIGPAVTATLRTILGTGTGVKASPARLTTAVPTLMLLTPTGEQNGVLVSQDPATTALLISNIKRRPCRVYVYQTTTLTAGVTTDVTPAALIAGPFALDSTENLGIYTALSDFTTFFHGTSPWSPVNLPAVPLALANGTDRTTYQVVVLASSWKVLASDTFEPPVFRDPHFATDIGAWRIDNKDLFYSSVFGDILFPIMCFLLGAGTIQVSRSVLAGVVTAAAAAKSAAFTRIISQLQYGSVGTMTDAFATVVREAITSTTSAQFWKAEVQQVIGQAEARALAAETAAAAGTRLSQASQLFLNVFAPIFAAGVILDGFDLGAVMLDLYNSELATSWTALLIRQTLNLTPVAPRVNAGEVVTFSVSNPANTPNGNFQYDWTQDSAFDTFSAQNEVNVGNGITTSQRVVDLLTTGSDINPVHVMVVGYDTSSGTRVEIGRAGTTVTFLPPAQIFPTNAALQVGEQRTFTVDMTPLPFPAGATFHWTLTGTAGSIAGSGTVVTTVPSVNYIAARGGIDSLHVDVLDAGGNLIGKATVPITVVAPVLDMTIAGIWPNNSAPALGTYHYSDLHGSRAANPAVGVDALLIDFDPYTADNITFNFGVSFIVVIPAGSALHAGQTFSKWFTGPPSIGAGQFTLGLAADLAHPENGNLPAPGNAGTFTITAVTTLADGSTVITFTFVVSNGIGGTITGSGMWGYR